MSHMSSFSSLKVKLGSPGTGDKDCTGESTGDDAAINQSACVPAPFLSVGSVLGLRICS